MRYPGFSGRAVKCPILTTVVQGFPVISLAVQFGANGAHFRDLYLARKYLLCVWNTLLLGETKFSRIWKISLDSILNCFTMYKCIVIQNDSWINIHEWFGCNFPTWNIRNVWRARDDGHHYDVTSKCCGVTITTGLVEWTLSISKINVFFCCFRELSDLKNTNGFPNKVWNKSKTTWAVGIAQLTHHSVRGGGKTPSTFGLGIFAPTTLNLVVS